MRQGVIHNRGECDPYKNATEYVYVVPLIVLGSGSVVKHRMNGVIMELTDGTNVKMLLDAVIKHRDPERGAYSALVISYRTVDIKGRIIANRTDLAVLNEKGDAIDTYSQGRMVEHKRPAILNPRYSIDVSEDGKEPNVKITEADFVIYSKNVAMDVLAVSMMMDNRTTAYERISHILGMKPEQSSISHSVTHPGSNIRSLTLRSNETNLQYTFNISGGK